MAISMDKLPKNIEAEKAILGAMLTSRPAKDKALAELRLSDFYSETHKKIFESIYNLNDKKIKVDIQTVTQELKNMKALDEVGGVDYLYELTKSLLLAENADEYIAMIKENANLRELLMAFGDIENQYLKQNISSYTTFVGEAQRRIDGIAQKRRISDFKSSKEVVDIVSKKILDLSETTSEGDLTGVDTGFPRLNLYTNGLQKENLIIVAGRTGLGKTAFALNLLLNAAKTGVPVGIFEMEMSCLTLYSRLVSNDADVKSRRILNGQIRGREVLKVKESLDNLAKLKIYVDESSAVSIFDLVAKARKLKAEEPELGLLVVDYLGLISTDLKNQKKRYDNRSLEIQEYTRTLHELARELKIPIVVLCQLNRKVEDREGGSPRLSDLRESGSIEQDAEIVLLLHSPDYGKNAVTEEIEKAKQQKKITAANMSGESRSELVNNAIKRTFQENQGNKNGQQDDVSIMNVIIAKNRNGESGKVVKLVFEKEYSRFTQASDDFVQREDELKNQYHNSNDDE